MRPVLRRGHHGNNQAPAALGVAGGVERVGTQAAQGCSNGKRGTIAERRDLKRRGRRERTEGRNDNYVSRQKRR